MPENIIAYDSITGEKVSVNRRWVDNPGIKHGGYVSKPPAKTSRTKREPVKTNKVADVVADPTDTPPIDGDSTEETS